MNVQNNHLHNLTFMSEPEISHLLKDDFVKPVPKHLRKKARQLLGGEKEVIVTDNNSPLAKWARKVRKNLNIQL